MTEKRTRYPQPIGTVCRKECARSSRQHPNVDLSRIDWYKCLFMSVARRICPSFTVRDEYKTTYNDIVRYCLMADGNLDPDKGLWLWGDIGTGKTTLLRIIRDYCALVRPCDSDGRQYGFRITNAVDVGYRFSSKGYDGIKEYIGRETEMYIGQSNFNTNLSREAFDELGSEPRIMQHYGSVLNVFQYILQMRYDRRGRGNITHVTTNLSPKQITEYYEARIYDRCKEMFNFVELRGKTFRT